MSALMVLLVSGVSLGQATLSSADKDSDGKVSTSEFKTYAESRLRNFGKVDEFVKAVDADGNGVITETEYAKRHEVLESLTAPLAVGDKADDFELQSIGKKIKLSDNIGENGKPQVVVFSRANW